MIDFCSLWIVVFRFIKYAAALGQKWGRAQRRAVSKWYTEQNPSKLAMAVTKYQNREGYSHRDVLRLSHPSTKDPLLCFLFDYITHGLEKAMENLNKPKEATSTDSASKVEEKPLAKTNDEEEEEGESSKKLVTIEQLKEFLETVEKVKKSTDDNELVAAIKQHRLVREHMPTGMLSSTTVWSALLENMPLTAMIRNLGKSNN